MAANVYREDTRPSSVHHLFSAILAVCPEFAVVVATDVCWDNKRRRRRRRRPSRLYVKATTLSINYQSAALV